MKTLWRSVALEGGFGDTTPTDVDVTIATADDGSCWLTIGDGDDVIVTMELPPGEGLQMALAICQGVARYNDLRHGYIDWPDGSAGTAALTVVPSILGA